MEEESLQPYSASQVHPRRNRDSRRKCTLLSTSIHPLIALQWVYVEDSAGVSEERRSAHPRAAHASSKVQSRAASLSQSEPILSEDVDMEDD